MRKNRKIQNFIGTLLMAALLTGCGANRGFAHESTFESAYGEEQESTSNIGVYDSADTAVVKSIEGEEQKITFTNTELGKSYTLDYDGATVIRDKYGSAMSMAQVRVGDIVEVQFLKDARKLVNITLSPEAFIYRSISKYNLDGTRGSASIGDGTYRLKSTALIVSEGKLIEAADVVSKDVVTVQGIGRNIFSVVVEKGHGYVRLSNDALVLGGWVEVGQAVIQEITEGMLLTVPEGAYDVHITARGVDTVRSVTVERNKEVNIDLGDIVVERPDIGKVFFTVQPVTATVYVDGEKADIGKAVEMPYGLHQIVCEASGYDTITQYIKVSQEIASVTITMDESAGEESYSSGVSGNSLVTGSYRVYIDSPVGVEVYQDNIYMGIAPVNFTKVAGSHTITLRKEGYVTRSYTIQIDSEDRDVTYSFTDLDKAESFDGSNSGVSGNTVSGNTVSGNSGNTVSGNSTESVSGN